MIVALNVVRDAVNDYKHELHLYLFGQIVYAKVFDKEPTYKDVCEFVNGADDECKKRLTAEKDD